MTRRAERGVHMHIQRDDIYEILSNRRRRFTIHYLRRNGSRAALGAIAEHVAAWENGVRVPEVGSDARKNVYTSLQQFHLPKMEQLNLVDFDRRAGEVELTEAAESVDVYMDVVRERDLPWSLYYLAVGGVAGALLLGHAAGVPGLAGLGDGLLGLFPVVSVCVLSVAHTYYSRQNQLGTDGPPPEVDR